MPVTIYHNPHCGKSREALRLLVERGVSPTVVEYLKSPPDAAELARVVALMGVRPQAILRAKEAKAAGIDPDAPDEILLAAMVAHPEVIERPIVVTENKAALGRPPERVLEIL
ncbi:MAG: arsenate reductase (glutaredoxin) [Alphaproteobacteria bacterium]|nr:arsenate reductase (glutaredoxin) [Alphaproteobacteria bacterium]